MFRRSCGVDISFSLNYIFVSVDLSLYLWLHLAAWVPVCPSPLYLCICLISEELRPGQSAAKHFWKLATTSTWCFWKLRDRKVDLSGELKVAPYFSNLREVRSAFQLCLSVSLNILFFRIDNNWGYRERLYSEIIFKMDAFFTAAIVGKVSLKIKSTRGVWLE